MRGLFSVTTEFNIAKNFSYSYRIIVDIAINFNISDVKGTFKHIISDASIASIFRHIITYLKFSIFYIIHSDK